MSHTINPLAITSLHADCINQWKSTGIKHRHNGFYQLVEENHAFNYQLWHAEDRARRDDMGHEFVYQAKREIDRCNQQRNNRMVGMIGFFFHSLRMNYLHLNQQKALNERPYYRLIEMKNKLENNYDTDNNLESNCFRESLKDGLVLDPAPQFFYQEWFEVIRSLFSGLGKGQKFVDFAGNPLQEVDEQGHCHDTPVMFVLASISAIFFGVILGLRAFARGLGRTPLGEVDLNADIELATIISKTNPETKAVSESMMVHSTEEGCKTTKVLEISEDLQAEILGEPKLTSKPQNGSHLHFSGSFFKQQPLPVLSCRGEHNLLIPDVSLTPIV